MRMSRILLLCIFSFYLISCNQLREFQAQSGCQWQTKDSLRESTDRYDLPPAMRRANIILFLLDDMDFSSIQFMPKVQELLVSQGTSFDNYLVNVSLCCPSRATTLLGMYAHNSGILTNNRPNGGFAVFKKLGHEEDNFVTRLEQAGYRTALFGKYLNGYPFSSWKKYIPPGWTEWYSPVLGDPYTEFNYSLNQNGEIVDYLDQPEDYLTDVLSKLANEFLFRNAETGTPFFIYLAPYAPHGPATPAPRHLDSFLDEIYPRSPSINEEDISDKPLHLQENALLSETDLEKIDDFHRSQLQSLLAVDEMVAQIVDTLKETGQFENSFIFITSDNGLHMGQHRLRVGKMSPYEEDIHVPLVVIGPGVQKGTTNHNLTGNIDLAPTFLSIAGLAIPGWMDGRSLLPLLSHSTSDAVWRQAYLIQHMSKDQAVLESALATGLLSWWLGTDRGLLEPPSAPELAEDEDDQDSIPEYLGLRLDRYTYVEYSTGEREFYNLHSDPYQLTNIAASVDQTVLDQLSGWLGCMSICTGEGCRLEERQAQEIKLP